MPMPLPIDVSPMPPKNNRTALWVGLGVVAALGVGAAIWAGTSGKDEAVRPTVVASSLPLPGKGVRVTGASGWAMTIPSEWSSLELSDEAAEGAWSTGGGDDTFGSNANVFTETPTRDVSLADYLQISEANMDSQLPGAVVVSNDLLQRGDQQFGRFEYSATVSGVDAHFLAYVIEVNGKFVVATFTTLDALFAAEAPMVEPYLATLSEQ